MKIKQLAAAMLALFILLTSFAAFAAAEQIIIDGEIAEIPTDMGTIMERDERTFVPIRFVMEHLGCSVEYDDANKVAIVTSSDCTYLVQEGNTKLFVIPDNATDTTPIEMDTTAFIEDVIIDGQSYGRMYIPIRFLAQAIGYTVGWNEDTQTVTLDMNK